VSFALAMLVAVLLGLCWGGKTARAALPSEARVSLVGGEPHPASNVGLERAPGVVVASAPVLHRCAAVPAPWSGDALASARDRTFATDGPNPTDAIVVRWRRHVPRMNDGDPPRSARLAS
jgi:hypothetical protein